MNNVFNMRWFGVNSSALMLTFIECMFCMIMMAGKLKKKRHFPLRVVVLCVIGLTVSFFLAVWYTYMDFIAIRIICYLSVSALNLMVLYCCYQSGMIELLIFFCSGIAIQLTTNKLYPLIQNAMGYSDLKTLNIIPNVDLPPVAAWTTYFTIHILMDLFLIHLFSRRIHLNVNEKATHRIMCLSITSVIIVNVLICIVRKYEGQIFIQDVVIKMFCLLFGIFILIACAGIFSADENEQQLLIIQQLWKQEQSQFESVKANMDAINIKCHDLKHILNGIEGKLTTEEIDRLKEAIQFYDANIKTGNHVLDVILSEKATICNQRGINFSCMVDGEKLNFLAPAQAYSLFGNIVDNAIEAVSYLENSDKKVISITTMEGDDDIEIQESNYYEGNIDLVDGSIRTRKDNANQHGFGFKSIQYIIEQYQGSMEILLFDQTFNLTISFPKK